MDPIIGVLKGRKEVLDLLGRIWEILYIEGSTPDIGRRRERVIKLILEKELGLAVRSPPPMERDWDIGIVLPGIGERRYSLKTSEGETTVKVAWNGFPSMERALEFGVIRRSPYMYLGWTIWRG